MIEQLFGSKTRVKLLQLFFSNPNRSFYVREITRRIDEQINSVRRELANLLSIGIISSDNKDNNRLYYEVNQKFEHYKALASIFGSGTISSKDLDKKNSVDDDGDISKVGNIELAVLTGQFTRESGVNADLVVVGDVNQAKINRFVSDLEAKENKEVRFVVMTPKEYMYREEINDRFLASLVKAKKQVLVDKKKRFK
ncbi:transcriptional regulator [Candidatus Saccharibacteria bacterium]|nr:transcriptional regulator [Candidatus Saccharibacteria bacterium]